MKLKGRVCYNNLSLFIFCLLNIKLYKSTRVDRCMVMSYLILYYIYTNTFLYEAKNALFDLFLIDHP